MIAATLVSLMSMVGQAPAPGPAPARHPPIEREATLSEAGFRKLVSESNKCLLSEVRIRLNKRTEISDEERSAVRTAAATACDDYNAETLRYMNYGGKSEKEARAALLLTSLKIANAFITTEIETKTK